MSNGVSPLEHERWVESYRRYDAPREGESLLGYALRLDSMNGLGAGETLNAIRRHTTGLGHLAQPTRTFTGTSFDLHALGRLIGGEHVSTLMPLTAHALSRALHPNSEHRVRTSSHRLGFRICPACAAERTVRLPAHLAITPGCGVHGLALVRQCTGTDGHACDATLSPCSKQQPFHCHRCGTDYALLPQKPLDEVSFVRARRIETIFADAAQLPEPPQHSDAALKEGLHWLVKMNDSPERGPWSYRSDEYPTIPEVVSTLAITGKTLADLFEAIRAAEETPLFVRRRKLRTPSRAVLSETVCPNALCTSDDLALMGWARPEVRRLGCKRCGTTFTRERVLTSFDPTPGYPRWRVTRSRQRLEHWRSAVRAAAQVVPAKNGYLCLTHVLRAAQIVACTRTCSDRAGLIAIIEEVARERGLRLRRLRANSAEQRAARQRSTRPAAA